MYSAYNNAHNHNDNVSFSGSEVMMIVRNYDVASYNRTDGDDDMKFTTTIKSLIMNLNFMLKKKYWTFLIIIY